MISINMRHDAEGWTEPAKVPVIPRMGERVVLDDCNFRVVDVSHDPDDEVVWIYLNTERDL